MRYLGLAGLAVLLALPLTANAAEPVTIGNLVRAESDTMFRATLATYKIRLGEIRHDRKLTSASEPQPVIRANQDTLYSVVVLDLSKRSETVFSPCWLSVRIITVSLSRLPAHTN